ncbi:MAG: DUF1415 family protein [Polyangiaceae bacterium]|nr:DUF1415 family protein [Polyangiaceae bacterium]
MSKLESEALRVYRRYQREVVEALNLCPWAEKARLDGHVTERVLLQRTGDLAPSLAAIAELEADPEIDIALLIYPQLPLDLRDFEAFVAELREADETAWPLGGVPFAAAAFHPRAARKSDAPERLIPYIRRSPDPTIQLVRRSVLDRMRQGPAEGTHFIDLSNFSLEDLPRPGQRPLRERIAKSNAETLKNLTFERFDALIAAILHDRDEAYGALGEDTRWS